MTVLDFPGSAGPSAKAMPRKRPAKPRVGFYDLEAPLSELTAQAQLADMALEALGVCRMPRKAAKRLGVLHVAITRLFAMCGETEALFHKAAGDEVRQ